MSTKTVLQFEVENGDSIEFHRVDNGVLLLVEADADVVRFELNEKQMLSLIDFLNNEPLF